MKLGTAHQGRRDRTPLGDEECPKIPGYQVLERLVGDPRGEGGEVAFWKAKRPGGFLAAIRVARLKTGTSTASADLLRGFEVLRRGRHPNLLAVFGSWRFNGTLVLASELPDRSLWDRYLECRETGERGIPRDELIEYLADVSRAIDYINGHAPSLPNVPATGLGMTHGELSPRAIVFVGGGIKLADVEIETAAHDTRVPQAEDPPRALDYAAPERAAGEPSRHADQYSLALVYCHLRTGRLPFSGADAVANRRPDLSALPAVERPSIARALADDPDDRWPSCRAFLNALQAVGLAAEAEIQAPNRPRWPGRTLALALAAATGAATFSTVVRLAPAPAPAPTTATQPKPEPITTARAALLPKIDRPSPPAPRFHLHDQDDALTPVASAPTVTEPPLPSRPDETATVEPPGATEPDNDKTANAPEPVIRLKAPEALTIEVGGSARLAVQLSCEGIVGPVEVRLQGLPAGLTASSRALVSPGTSEQPRIVEFEAAPGSREGETLARLVAIAGPIRAEATVRVKVQPGPAVVARRRADASLRREEYAAAVSAYNEAIARNANDPLALHGRGLAYYGLGDLNTALADLEATVRLTPASPTALNNRGLIRLAKGDPAAAIADFDAAIRIDPGYAVVRYNRGRAYVEAGAADKALPDFDEAIRLDSRFARAYKARADLHAHKGDRPRALADYNEAIRLRPDDPTAFNNRGLLRFAAGDHPRALADFDEAIRLNPRYAVVRYNRGRVQADLGDKAEALRSFELAIRLDPTLTCAADARTELLSQGQVPNQGRREARVVAQVSVHVPDELRERQGSLTKADAA